MRARGRIVIEEPSSATTNHGDEIGFGSPRISTVESGCALSAAATSRFREHLEASRSLRGDADAQGAERTRTPSRELQAAPFPNYNISVLPPDNGDNDDEVLVFTPEMLSAGLPNAAFAAGGDDNHPVALAEPLSISGGDRCASAQEAMQRAASYVALPLHRAPMMARRAAPYNHHSRPRYRGVGWGLLGLLRCTPAAAMSQFSPNPDDPGTPPLPASIEDDNDDEDDDYVPIMYTPLWLQAAFAAVVAGAAVLVFAVPDFLDFDLKWSGASLDAVDALLPLVLFATATFARSVAHSRGVDLSATDRFHRIHSVDADALSSYFVDLERSKVQSMAESRERGLLVRRGTMRKLSMHLQAADDTADGSREQPPSTSPLRRAAAQLQQQQRSVIRASLYAEMIVSNASLTTAVETHAVPLAISLGLPVAVAVSPIAGRFVVGGSLWGRGSLPELVLLVAGTILSACAAHTLAIMVNLHSETLRFHEVCIERVTGALPVDGSGSPDDDPHAQFFPQIPFVCVGNVMAWHRIRWALGYAPHALASTGTIVFEAITLLTTAFITFSIISDFTLADGRFAGAGSGVALVLSLIVPALTTTLLRTPLRVNGKLESHVGGIATILVQSLGADSYKAQKAAAHVSGSRAPNPLDSLAVRSSGTRSQSIVSDDSLGGFDVDFETHMRLRRVLRDVAAAIPHHTIYHRFLGVKVTPLMLLAFLAVYAALAVISIYLFARHFVG